VILYSQFLKLLIALGLFDAGVNLVAQYEGAGYGLTWADIGEDGFSIARILTLLVTDSLLYILLAW
jgi:hypothetical protein